MDPCPFVRILISNLGVKIPSVSKPAGTGVHPSTSPCFCKIHLKHFPNQTAIATVPLINTESTDNVHHNLVAATFHLSKADVLKLAAKSKSSLFLKRKKPCLKISIYIGRRGTACGVNSGRLLGTLRVPLDLSGSEAETKPCVFHKGWIAVGNQKDATQMHLCVRSEPDPRFVFQFQGDPECSPQVLQVQGTIPQPVFTCNFSFRNSTTSDRERKGWSLTVHDLSGSPVALASMVTPFVASPGSDRVSRSNPGAWLILRPGEGTWKPWGRLEAWRERASSDALGYRFQLLVDDINSGMDSKEILLAESSVKTSKGGKFVIDGTTGASGSPGCTPKGSGEFGYGLWAQCLYRGFVMSSTVQGEGKCSKPVVEVSVQHVNCTEDAAAFVALAAAIDLSMDACRLFSDKLRKELSQHHHHHNHRSMFG